MAAHSGVDDEKFDPTLTSSFTARTAEEPSGEDVQDFELTDVIKSGTAETETEEKEDFGAVEGSRPTRDDLDMMDLSLDALEGVGFGGDKGLERGGTMERNDMEELLDEEEFDGGSGGDEDGDRGLMNEGNRRGVVVEASGETSRDPAAKAMERALVDAIETLGDIASFATKFSYDSQDSLYSKVNALVDEFKALDQAAQKTKMSVPFEVIAAIDRGRNPQQMTYRMLEDISEAGSAGQRKRHALSIFRDALQRKMEQKDEDERATEIHSSPNG